MAVTWDVPQRDFAALVVHASSDHLRVWIYNFASQKTRMGMRLWQLHPGRYEVNCGPLGSGKAYRRNCRWQHPSAFTVRHRADTCWVDVPPRQEFAVDLRLTRRIERDSVLPDPAIAERDLVISRHADGKAVLSVTVHNLGSVAVPDLQVVLVGTANGVRGEIARRTVEMLPGSEDLRSGRVRVSFTDVKPTGNLSVVLDPQDKTAEIYECNNEAQLNR
jgi:hypothetical protein